MAFIALPDASQYTLLGARIPLACCKGLGGTPIHTFRSCEDGLLDADIEVRNGLIFSISPASDVRVSGSENDSVLDLRGSIVLPTFADLHTHIGTKSGKGHFPCFVFPKCTVRQVDVSFCIHMAIKLPSFYKADLTPLLAVVQTRGTHASGAETRTEA